MSAGYQEIEVKLLVDDLASVEARLQSLGAAQTVPRVYEHNIRYQDPAGTFVRDGVVLRLRKDHKSKLTFKSPLSAEELARGIHRRFEAEVTVSDFDAMHTILTQLGYNGAMQYEKYRTTYTLNGAEIVLDEMPFGHFVEIEADDEAAIEALVVQLGLADAPRMGYSYALLFDHVRRNLKLSINDLTFANFDGVDVPAAAFNPPEDANR